WVWAPKKSSYQMPISGDHAAAPTEQDRGRGTLNRARCPDHTVDPVPGPRVLHALPAQQGAHDLDGLAQALDPLRRRAERDPGRLVLLAHPARPEPEVEPAAGHHVE